MKLKHLIAAATVAGAAMASQPAAAYEFTTTGNTHATRQLTADVLRDIARYSKANGGCSFLFSAHMAPLPRSAALVARGGYQELWTVNACAAKQRFRVTMWPSARGGSDYTVVPLTGRMPLYVR